MLSDQCIRWLGRPLTDPSLRKIALGLALLSCLFASLIVHLVSVLTASGYSRATAAGVMSAVALSAIPGKLGTGWLLDHAPVGLIAGVTFALPAVPCLGLLLFVKSWPIIVVSVGTLGWAMGGYLQASAYLTTRYAGLRHFGLIFGIMMSMMAITTGVGPTLIGAIYDRTGSYTILFVFGIVAAGVAGLLMATLRRYPDWADAQAR